MPSASPSITNDLAAQLRAVRTPGDFFVAGVSVTPLPLLQVDGVGPVALPLLPAQAQQLIAVAQRAPFGRGQETLVDTTVRRTWQIAADCVQFGGQHWQRNLQDIVARVATGLGVSGSVVADFYKLLVYDPGSFFVSHRDTEKAPGMFATLVVALPSPGQGGELVVQHPARGVDAPVRLDLRSADPSELAFAAFYADCVHEVLPVTAGYRLVLVYNLLRTGRSRPPQPPDYRAETASVAALLQQWSTPHANRADPAPDKLVYPLAHAYTPAELSFQALKGEDAAVAGVLTAAAAQSDCDIHVALLTIEESGSAEHTGHARPRRWGYEHDDDDDGVDEDDDGAFEIGEVFDRSLTLSHWCRVDDGPAGLGALPFTDAEISPSDALQDMQPDTQHFQEATGNEGASFDRNYQRAALVLWPRHRALAVLNQAGLPSTLDWLDALAGQWALQRANTDSPLWRDAHELAGHMLRTWPQAVLHPLPDDPGDAGRMLLILVRLKDVERIEAMVVQGIASGQHASGDNPAVLQALRRVAPKRAGELLEYTVKANAGQSLGACIGLIGLAAASPLFTGRTAGVATPYLRAAARALVDALPGDPVRPTSTLPTWQQRPIDAVVVADLMLALWQVDAGLADRAAAHLLAWPLTFDLDALLVPAARRWVDHTAAHATASFQRLLAACLAHLQARAALPLAPPADWSRSSSLPCRCSHCQALSRFLASPTDRVWQYKAAELARRHLMVSIRTAACDVDSVTIKQGSPHALMCTKNQASYARRAAQRQQDLQALALLGAVAR